MLLIHYVNAALLSSQKNVTSPCYRCTSQQYRLRQLNNIHRSISEFDDYEIRYNHRSHGRTCTGTNLLSHFEVLRDQNHH